MSFFSGDVVAKEQLPGAVGSPIITVTVLPSGVAPHAPYVQPQAKRRLSRNLLSLIRDYLETKT